MAVDILAKYGSKLPDSSAMCTMEQVLAFALKEYTNDLTGVTRRRSIRTCIFVKHHDITSVNPPQVLAPDNHTN